MTSPSDSVDLVEVSPRDGLQNEAVLVSTADKLALIDRARAAGLVRIEATSFVNPKMTPQMADAEAVARGCLERPGGAYSMLALNPKGLDRAITAGAKEVNYVFVASDALSVRNSGVPTLESLARWPDVHARARESGVKIAVVIGAAFGCPYEGEVPIQRLLEVVSAFGDTPPDELALADTIGVAAPSDVRERFAVIRDEVASAVSLRAHFHDTRNTAIANAVTAYECGVRVLDSSLGGIGGCPFATGAAGNVATEDMVYVFERMGVRTGVDLDQAIAGARWILEKLGRQQMGAVARAGGFPGVSSVAFAA